MDNNYLDEIYSLPKEKKIIPPDNGWESQTLYLINVSMRPSNPIFQAYLHVGFLNKAGEPAAYSEIWGGGEDRVQFNEVYYLRIISVLHRERRF